MQNGKAVDSSFFWPGDHFCLHLSIWNEGPSTFKFQKVKETAYRSGEERPVFVWNTYLGSLKVSGSQTRNGLFDLGFMYLYKCFYYISIYKECAYPYNPLPLFLWTYHFNHPSNFSQPHPSSSNHFFANKNSIPDSHERTFKPPFPTKRPPHHHRPIQRQDQGTEI